MKNKITTWGLIEEREDRWRMRVKVKKRITNKEREKERERERKKSESKKRRKTKLLHGVRHSMWRRKRKKDRD